MKLMIKKQIENPLLKRSEVIAELVFGGATPSNTEVINELASQAKVSADIIDVREIKTGFGQQIAKVTAYIYKDAAAKKEMVKQKGKKKKKAQAAGAGAAKKK